MTGAPLDQRVARCRSRLQMEAVECGAASLAMVLDHFGRDVPLSELREELGVSRNGSSAAEIVRAARHYGLQAHGFAVPADGVRHLPGPVIAFWGGNHFLVVEGYRRGRWLLNDPARGTVRLGDEEFAASFGRVALTFDTTDAFVRRRDTAWSYLRTLLRPLLGQLRAVFYLMLVGLARVVPTLVAAFLAGVFVSRILAAHDPQLLTGVVLLLVAVAAVQTVLAYLEKTIFYRLDLTLSMKLESGYLWRLFRLPVSFFYERSAGQLTSRIGVNRMIAGLLAGQIGTGVVNAFSAVIYGAVLFALQPALAAVLVVLALGEALLLRYTSRLRVNRAQQAVQLQMAFAGVSMSGLKSIESIKASGHDNEFFARWCGVQTALLNSTQRFGVPAALMSSARSLLQMVENLAVLVLGGLLVLDGRMTVAALVTFSALATRFLTPVVDLSRLTGIVQTTRAAIDQLHDVTRHPTDPQTQAEPLEQLSADTSPARQLAGRIEFRDVTFGFEQGRPPLIKDLSFSVPAGGRIALVGGSGSGKSTIAHLASGLYQPWSGQILFDGVPRGDWARAVLSGSIANVDTDIVLIDGSVRDNLCLWTPAASAAVYAAARDAAIHDEIVARPGGYDALVSEGGRNFSGGEAQRLEIARALVGNPTVLILDEATSAVDAATELQIDTALRRRGPTCVVIAHRLSTIRDCDEILVLSGGSVLERGTHDELVARDGVYRTLVHGQ